MTEDKELALVRRKDWRGEPSVAPFIRGWNVWNIPSREWTFSVQEAIKHAYELGWRHCNEAHTKIDNFEFNAGAYFEEAASNSLDENSVD